MAALPPLVIGVTGHRNIASDDPQLSALVADEVASLRIDHPKRDFIALSALAEGADRLVAKVLLEEVETRLIVPLPLPVDDGDGYKKDFPDTVDEFDGLLARADGVVTPPLLSDDRAWADYGEPRNDQYAWLGGYLTEHAHVLIALWDGAPARGTGGTAYVVDWFRNGSVPEKWSSRARPPKSGAEILPFSRPEIFIHIHPTTHKVTRERLQT